MSFFLEGLSTNANSNMEYKDLRVALNGIYTKIRAYEKNSLKLKDERQVSREMMVELEFKKKENMENLEKITNNEMSEFDKLKKQMDFFIFESEIEGEISDLKSKIDKTTSLNAKFLNEIISEMRKIEIMIYVASRFNTTWYPPKLQNIDRKFIAEQLKLNENLEKIKIASKGVFKELNEIYQYYQKAQKAVGNDKNKIEMLENLLEYMITEVIKKDMEKNNIVLPSGIKGMRYFK